MLPSINQIIFLSLDNGKNFTLKSRVADINQEKLSVEMPIDKESGRLKIIPTGSKIKAWYIFEDHGQFSFETEVIEIAKGQVPLLILKHPERFDRLQRRDYLRVSASLDAAIKLTGSNEEQGGWNVVRTIDIGGGGMQFLFPHFKMKLDQQIKGWITLPFRNGSIVHVSFKGKVTRVSQPNESSRVFLISIKFIEIHEIMRANVVRFCYEKQVEINKKIHKIN